MEIGIIEAEEIKNEYPNIHAQYERNGKKPDAYFITGTDANGNPIGIHPIYVEEPTAEEQEIIDAINAGAFDEEEEEDAPDQYEYELTYRD